MYGYWRWRLTTPWYRLRWRTRVVRRLGWRVLRPVLAGLLLDVVLVTPVAALARLYDLPVASVPVLVVYTCWMLFVLADVLRWSAWKRQGTWRQPRQDAWVWPLLVLAELALLQPILLLAAFAR